MTMAAALTTKAILTANDVRNGDIVFWTADQRWSPSIDNALIGYGKDETDQLAAVGVEAEAANTVVGAYLIALKPEETSARVPVKLREVRRLAGPSIDYAQAA
jgi:hypothetical protein